MVNTMNSLCAFVPRFAHRSPDVRGGARLVSQAGWVVRAGALRVGIGSGLETWFLLELRVSRVGRIPKRGR